MINEKRQKKNIKTNDKENKIKKSMKRKKSMQQKIWLGKITK